MQRILLESGDHTEKAELSQVKECCGRKTSTHKEDKGSGRVFVELKETPDCLGIMLIKYVYF